MPRHTINRGVAKASLDLGQYTAAIKDVDKAIQLKPDYAEAYLNRGSSKALLNQTWAAKQDLQTALRLAENAGDESLKAQIEEWLRGLK